MTEPYTLVVNPALFSDLRHEMDRVEYEKLLAESPVDSCGEPRPSWDDLMAMKAYVGGCEVTDWKGMVITRGR